MGKSLVRRKARKVKGRKLREKDRKLNRKKGESEH